MTRVVRTSPETAERRRYEASATYRRAEGRRLMRDLALATIGAVTVFAAGMGAAWVGVTIASPADDGAICATDIECELMTGEPIDLSPVES